MRARRRASPEVRVHFLDVGRKEYGDAVLCRLGERSVLIDGAHPGDQVGSRRHPSIPDQLGTLLEQNATPYRVDLLIVTHAHQDHIGCLPFLVEHELLKADWALVADPNLGWGRPANDDARPEPVDSRVLHLAGGLREELLSDRTDDATLAQFLADAVDLEQRYRTMLRKLGDDGTRIVRHGRDRPRELLAAFDDVGLRVLGPSQAQLFLCAEAIREATDAVTRAAVDLLSRDDGPSDAVDGYRRLVSSGVDALDAGSRPGPPINLQSIVTRFDLDGVKLLFAGDMQLADPQVSDPNIDRQVRRLRATLRAEAPFDLVKVCHHGSDNAISADVMAELGTTPLYGICAGERSEKHPNARVLRLFDERRDRVQWVRTDRNGQATVTFAGGPPQLSVKRGRTSDATPNVPDDVAAPTRAAAAQSPGTSVPIVREAREDVEVVARIPHADTRVSITVEIAPRAGSGAPAPITDGEIGAGRDLSGVLFVTSREGLARNIGRSEAEQLLAAIERKGLLLYDELPAGHVDSSAAIELVREQVRGTDGVRGVVILGGYDVVPARRLDCLPPPLRTRLGRNDDPDDFVVWSDDGYGDLEGDRAPELPVSRVPDGRSEDFLLAALRTRDRPPPAPRRGVRNVARPFADGIYAGLPGDEPLLLSAPTVFDDAPPIRLDAEHVYLMLHGDFLDSARFWGEQTANDREAVNINNIPEPTGRVVFTGCCWGALVADQPAARTLPGEPPAPKLPNASIALTFLARGATAFVGCTGAHYSPTLPPYDYFGGPMHAAFWARILAGSAPAAALFQAKVEYARGLPHGRTSAAQQAIELKTLHQYTCLGVGW